MKKLKLDNLTVESFATSPVQNGRGTVHAFERTLQGCPDSWAGTCWMTCWETCTADSLDTYC